MLAYAADDTFEEGPLLSTSASAAAGEAAAPGESYLDQEVSRFFYRWGGHLSASLVRPRGRFDGDLDQYLLYLVFVLTEPPQAMAGGRLAPGQRPQTRRGLNALSLSDITR